MLSIGQPGRQVTWSTKQSTFLIQQMIHSTFSKITILFSSGLAQTVYCLFMTTVILVLNEAHFHQVPRTIWSMYAYSLGHFYIIYNKINMFLYIMLYPYLNGYSLLPYPLNLVFFHNRLQNKG